MKKLQKLGLRKNFKTNICVIGVGYVGNLVDNFDGSYSFFKVVKIFPSSYIPLEKVYGKASSLLYRKRQDEAKVLGISNFYKDLKIVKNSSLF